MLSQCIRQTLQKTNRDTSGGDGVVENKVKSSRKFMLSGMSIISCTIRGNTLLPNKDLTPITSSSFYWPR
jgi:hypothetical protein